MCLTSIYICMYVYVCIYIYGTPPPGTYVWMEIVASAVETNLFQWLFGGFIFVVIRRVHFLRGCITIARLKFNRPIELQSGSGFKTQDSRSGGKVSMES